MRVYIYIIYIYICVYIAGAGMVRRYAGGARREYRALVGLQHDGCPRQHIAGG